MLALLSRRDAVTTTSPPPGADTVTGASMPAGTPVIARSIADGNGAYVIVAVAGVEPLTTVTETVGGVAA